MITWGCGGRAGLTASPRGRGGKGWNRGPRGVRRGRGAAAPKFREEGETGWGGSKCASASKGEEEGAALGGPGEEREAGLEIS